MPSGIVVASQNDRSQHKNRATAMGMLKARLYEAELRKREEAASGEYAAKTEIGWGHQIRSYVLQPYQMVKDLRTGVTSPTPSDVLDGDLDSFIAAALAQRVTGEAVAVEDDALRRAFDLAGAERRGWFITNDEGRLKRDSPSDGDSLALTTAKFVRKAL